MASEQTNPNVCITKAVAEAATRAIQNMSMAGTARTEYTIPRMNYPIMKQPTFD